MQYQVPQFIDVEDKIVGPLTLRQFLYLAAGFLISFSAFFVLKFFVWLLLALIVGSCAIAFAFVKYNGRSFFTLIKSVFNYFWRPRLYVRKESSVLPSGGRVENLDLKLNTSRQPIVREKPFKFAFLNPFAKVKERYEVFKKVTGEREVARRVDYR